MIYVLLTLTIYHLVWTYTALHAAYWTKNDVIMKMLLVHANATNVETVQAVSHDLISLYLFVYMLCICLTLCL